MIYEWNAAKRASNLQKHGVDFNDAIGIFEGLVVAEPDERRDYGEVRYHALGRLGESILVVVFTFRGDNLRIISARRANSRERTRYSQAYSLYSGAREN